MSATFRVAGENLLAFVRKQRPPFALAYHGISPEPPSSDPHHSFVALTTFRQQLQQLRGLDRSLVGITEIWRRSREAGGADGYGALTFDDGLASTLALVIEVLGHDEVATIYIPTAFMGKPHPHVRDERVVDRAQLLELGAAGLEIGAHSVDHPDLRTLNPQDLAEQMRRSKATLEDLLGRPVPSMAYPYGAMNNRVVAAAQEAGYETACGCSGAGRWVPFALPREPIFQSTTPARLSAKIAGLYGPVHWLARARARTAAASSRGAKRQRTLPTA